MHQDVENELREAMSDTIKEEGKALLCFILPLIKYNFVSANQNMYFPQFIVIVMHAPMIYFWFTFSISNFLIFYASDFLLHYIM